MADPIPFDRTTRILKEWLALKQHELIEDDLIGIVAVCIYENKANDTVVMVEDMEGYFDDDDAVVGAIQALIGKLTKLEHAIMHRDDAEEEE